jgi:hypothetical protein
VPGLLNHVRHSHLARVQEKQREFEAAILEARRNTPVTEPGLTPEQLAEQQAAANVRALLEQTQVSGRRALAAAFNATAGWGGRGGPGIWAANAMIVPGAA